MASRLLLLLLALSSLSLAQCDLRVFELRATGLPDEAVGRRPDGYVEVYSGQTHIGKTEKIQGDNNPWWNEEFYYHNAQQDDMLRLEVYDKDLFIDDDLGVCSRRLKRGTYRHYCDLEKGGRLYYSYTLS